MRQLNAKRNYSLSEAIEYLGVKRRWFDENIRPRVHTVRCGTSELIDIRDLDSAWDEYVVESSKKSEEKTGEKLCAQLKQREFNVKKMDIKLTKFSGESAFSRAASKILLMQKRS